MTSSVLAEKANIATRPTIQRVRDGERNINEISFSAEHASYDATKFVSD